MVLRSGEPALLLEARLADFRPVACPATVDATLKALTTTRETLVIVAGDAEVRQATVDALPEHVRVTRIAPAGTTPANNQGITTHLGRPDNESPFLILVVGYPAEGAQVPVISKKPLGEIVTRV